MHIIVKRDGSKPTSRHGRVAFTPHWNTSMDKRPVWCATQRQFDRELKMRGLELYDPSKAPSKPKRKPYKPSSWGESMHRHIKTVGKNVRSLNSDRFIDELKSRGCDVTKRNETLKALDSYKGGYF